MHSGKDFLEFLDITIPNTRNSITRVHPIPYLTLILNVQRTCPSDGSHSQHFEVIFVHA